MANSGWAVVVVVALAIVALFGYWAIEGGGDMGGDRGEATRIETDVEVDRQPAERSGGTDVDVRQESSSPPAEERGEPAPAP